MSDHSASDAECAHKLIAQACEAFANGFHLLARASAHVAPESTPAVTHAVEHTLLTRREYARRSRFSEATLSRLIAEGLPVSYAGTRARIDPLAADAWLAARGSRPTKAKASAPKRDAANDVDVSGVLARGGFVKGTAA